MPQSNEQIEEWASVAWDDYYAGNNSPLWKDLSGDAKDKQLKIAADCSTKGASPGNELEMAYAQAFRDWEADQVVVPAQKAKVKTTTSVPIFKEPLPDNKIFPAEKSHPKK